MPYGVYDVAASIRFVNVGTDHNTAALAVESIRRWRDLAGRDACPGAGRLLVCCDAGGSNGWRNRAWKAGLAQFAQDSGLEITVCHFPPRHLQVEQDRAPAVLPDHPELARPPADQPRRHHQHHRRDHDRHRADRHRRPGPEPLPHRNPGQRRADDRSGDQGLNAPRLPRRMELHLPAGAPARAAGTARPARARPGCRRRPRRPRPRRGRAGQPGADRPVPPGPRRPGRGPRTALGRRPRAATPSGPRSLPPRPHRPGAPFKYPLQTQLLATIYHHRPGMPSTRIAALPGAHHTTIAEACQAITSLPGTSYPALAPGPVRVRTLTRPATPHHPLASITHPCPSASRTPPQIAQ